MPACAEAQERVSDVESAGRARTDLDGTERAGAGVDGAGRARALFESAQFHAALIAAGTLFLLAGAFHGNVWFDESYSVGMAGHSFADIWAIGTGDVHPVLFYWALHALSLAFGQNILVYRLFALAGSVALGVLGLSHVRRDFGARAGVLFSFFALFTPYVANMSVEIRMYSWAVFCVAACSLYAWRVFSCIRRSAGNGRKAAASGPTGQTAEESWDDSVRARAALLPQWAGAPRRWWAAFFALSLASAYLHYFGVIAAFIVNLSLFLYLALRTLACAVRRKQKASDALSCTPDRAPRALGVFLAGAVVQVACYLPWLPSVLQQLSVVGATYWANFTFPTTLIELATYPMLTSGVSFAQRGAYGAAAQTALAVLLCAFVLAAIAGCVLALARGVRGAARSHGARAALGAFSRWIASDGVLACLVALVAYVGVFVFADTASRIGNSFLLYYRYMFVAFGLLLAGASLLTARVARTRVGAVAVAVFCTAYLGTAAVNQALLLSDNYSNANTAPLAAIEEAADWADDAPFGYIATDSTDSANEPQDGMAVENGRAVVYSSNAAFSQTVDAPLMLSSDIGIQGVAAVQLPDIAQTYMDWQPGYWALSYQAYAPTLSSVKTWEVALDGYQGRFVVLGQSQDGSVPRDVADVAQKPGVTCVDVQTFYRPYERTYFAVARMEKN